MIEIFITTCKRPKWCLNLLNDIKQQGKGHEYNVRIYHDDEGTDYSEIREFCKGNKNFHYYQTAKHFGKQNYWLLNNLIYTFAEQLEYDYIIQLPDDVVLVDNFFKRVTGLLNDKIKICNFFTTNLHLKSFLANRVEVHNGVEYWQNNLCDGCFISTKKIMDGLRIKQPVINFKNRGSGLAQVFINAINERGIKIYQTKYALMEHIGAYDSVMHSPERVKEIYGDIKDKEKHPLLFNLTEKDKKYIESDRDNITEPFDGKPTVLIFQDGLAIRPWKFGYVLNSLGYNVSYAYTTVDFSGSYKDLDISFVKNIYKLSYGYSEFISLIYQFDYVVIINAWHLFSGISIENNVNIIHYIGDTQTLRTTNKRSLSLEYKAFTHNHKIIFSNEYLLNKIKTYSKINFIQDVPIIPNSYMITDGNKNQLENISKKHIINYNQKETFNLVYIGSISDKVRNHRYLLDTFKKIASPNIHIFIYSTFHNNQHIKELLNSEKYITAKDTANYDNIIEELKRYDYGLSLFNLEYNDAPYIEISQPNKFYDYYFARLPIICNNTHSFNDFINKNKIGFCIDSIDEINTENLKRSFDFSKAKIKYYNEYVENVLPDIFNDNTKINRDLYKQIYVSRAMIFFKNSIIVKYNLKDYTNKNEPCLFFGVYNQDDVDSILNHNGTKKILLGGHDAIYKTFINNIRRFADENIEIVCQSMHIYNQLQKLNYPKTLNILSPFTPTVLHSFYVPNNVKGDNIYIYTSDTRSNVYGEKIYKDVIQKLKHKFNFIICSHKTTSDIKSVYSKCFVGLRLTSFDGLGCTNIELGLMGIKCITNNISPNCLAWNNVDDIINHIINESKNIGKSNSGIANETYKFMLNEYNILKI